MTSPYRLPESRPELTAPPRTAYLVASGDLRPAANAAGWPAQEALEKAVTAAFAELGWSVVRAHQFDPQARHGFIDSQRRGLQVFATLPPDAPLIVAEAVWQYSHHVLAGLRSHRGPILTVANFDGTWPGLVGLLGLNAGLTKMGREYSTSMAPTTRLQSRMPPATRSPTMLMRASWTYSKYLTLFTCR